MAFVFSGAFLFAVSENVSEAYSKFDLRDMAVNCFAAFLLIFNTTEAEKSSIFQIQKNFVLIR